MSVPTLQILRSAARAFSRNNVPVLGAALAFYSAFSVAPLLIVSLGVAGLIFGQEAARGELHSQLTGLLGGEGARFIQDAIASIEKNQKGGLAALTGALVLFIGATGVFAQLQNALNTIWHVESKHSGMWTLILSRWTSFTMVLGIGFLLLISLVLSSIVALMTNLLPLSTTLSGAVLELINAIVSLSVATALFLVIFRVLPGVKLAWRDILFGALLTALLFTVGKTLLGLYLGRAAVASSFGAAGTAIVLLLWVYYSAQILLFGAECTAAAVRLRGRKVTIKPGFEVTKSGVWNYGDS